MLSAILTVIRLLPRVNGRKTLLFTFFILFSSILPIAIAIFTGLLVGSVPAAAVGGIDSEGSQAMLSLLAAVAGLVVLQRVIGPLQSAVAVSLGREVDRYLQERAMAAVGRPEGIAHLENADILNRLRLVRGLGMDTNRPSLAVMGLAAVVPAWLQALGASAVLMVFHWWLGLAWLVIWPVLLYFMQREYLKVGQVGYRKSTELRRAEYLRDLVFTPTAAKEIRIWGMLDWLVTRFETVWRSAIEPVWKARKPSGPIVFGTSGTVTVINLVSYGLLAWAAIQGDLTLAALAVFTQALSRINIFTAFNDENAYISYAAVAVPKVLELDTILREDRLSQADIRNPEAPQHEIRFEQVYFRYPGSEREALRSLDLVIPARRSLAIVGENGAGKTSLVKLLCGLYQPASGQICIDGIPVSDLEPAAWRRQVAVLFQDFTRYQLSVRDNISFGAPGQSGNFERMKVAAEKAGALGLIEALPQGWDTILSPEYSSGVDLSGGQWQRIALARALFAVEAGARVLILDEPTAALDVRAEAELYNSFLKLTEGLTTILISHRFSTVRRADRIVVLSDGKVIEEGTHAELLALNGQYEKMFRLQAARFSDASTPMETGESLDA